MIHTNPNEVPVAPPGVAFTKSDLKTIYSVFIDRYEHLDAVLRSLPTPSTREEAEAEKVSVENIIKKLCNEATWPQQSQGANHDR